LHDSHANRPKEPGPPEQAGQDPQAIDSDAPQLERFLRARLPRIWSTHGPDAPLTRLLTRALEESHPNEVYRLRFLRLAQFAVDRLDRAPLTLGAGDRPSLDALAPAIDRIDVGDYPPSVLVVHHDRAKASALIDILTDAGYGARYADSTERAREELDRATPALVIADLLLPPSGGSDGVSLAREIIARDIPVLLICSLPVAEREYGLGFLRRDFDRDELLLQIQRLLEQRK
jgi:CheY-like chemotaxis protein